MEPLAVYVSATMVDWPILVGTDTTKGKSHGKVVTGVLTYKWRNWILVMDSLRWKVISLFHDYPESGHFGAFKTTELISQDFHCPVMDSHVHRYVSGCEVWHHIESPRHTRHGINMPIWSPSRPWEGITIDFVTNCPKSMSLGYSVMLVMAGWLTKKAVNLPCRKDFD